MKKEFGYTTIYNAEKFEEFLEENQKGYYDVGACWEVFVSSFEGNSSDYELGGFETKSGNSETISFRVKYIYHMADGRTIGIDEETVEIPSDLDDFDYIETIIEF